MPDTRAKEVELDNKNVKGEREQAADSQGDLIAELVEGTTPAAQEADDLVAQLEGGPNPGRQKEEESADEPDVDESDEEDNPEEPEQPSDEPAGEGSDEASDSDDDEEPTEEDDAIAEMRAEIERLSGEKLGVKEETSDDEPAEPETPEARVPDLNFITDEDAEKIAEDPMHMNEVLKRVYLQAQQDVLANIPQIVEKSATRSVQTATQVQAFYSDNPDLKSYKKTVGFTANEIQAENPDWDIQKVLTETEKRVRKVLRIQKQAADTEANRDKKPGKKPAFPSKPKGSRKGKPKDNRNEQQKQIDDLI